MQQNSPYTMNMLQAIINRLPTRKQIRNTSIHLLFGNRLFSKELWKFTQKSVAEGVALGLFVAFTPTIPFQMLLVTAFALWFRVNLPVAVLLVWITNPLTAAPIYIFQLRLGKRILDFIGIDNTLMLFRESLRGFFKNAFSLMTGSVICALAASLLGYVLVNVFWRFASFEKTHLQERIAALKAKREERRRRESDL